MKLSLVLEAIDKASAPLRKVTSATSGTAKAMGQLGNRASKSAGPMARLSRLVHRSAVDTDRLKAISYNAGKMLGRVVRIGAQAATIGIATLSTGAVAIARAVFKAGMTYDKGFAAKVTKSTAAMSAAATRAYSRFLLTIGKAGVFDFIADKLQAVASWVDRLAASGAIDRWAKQIASAMLSIGNWLASINWMGMAKDILAIGRAVFNVGRFLAAIGGGGFSGVFNIAVVAVIGKMAFALYGLGAALGIVSIVGAPLWAIVAVIAAIGSGAWLVYRNWSVVSESLGVIWEGLKSAVASAANAIVGFFKSMWNGIKTAFSTGVKVLWNSLPLWFRGLLTGATFVVRTIAGAISGQQNTPAAGKSAPSRPAFTAPQLRHGAPIAPASQGKVRATPPQRSEIALHVTTDRGVSVKPKKIVTPHGGSLVLNTGRAMGGAA